MNDIDITQTNYCKISEEFIDCQVDSIILTLPELFIGIFIALGLGMAAGALIYRIIKND